METKETKGMVELESGKKVEKIILTDEKEITLKDGRKIKTHPKNVEIFKKKGLL